MSQEDAIEEPQETEAITDHDLDVIKNVDFLGEALKKIDVENVNKLPKWFSEDDATPKPVALEDVPRQHFSVYLRTVEQVCSQHYHHQHVLAISFLLARSELFAIPQRAKETETVGQGV